MVQLNELKSMQAKLDELKDSVMDKMKCEMEKRGFASTECNTKKITNAIDGLGRMIERIGNRRSPSSRPCRERRFHLY